MVEGSMDSVVCGSPGDRLSAVGAVTQRTDAGFRRYILGPDGVSRTHFRFGPRSGGVSHGGSETVRIGPRCGGNAA